MKLYLPDAVNSQVAEYTNLVITSGTGSAAAQLQRLRCTTRPAPTCTPVSSATSPPTTTDYANGLADNPLAKTKWDANDTVTYRVRVELQDTNSANSQSATGYTTGVHKYVWEAQQPVTGACSKQARRHTAGVASGDSRSP